MLPFMNPQNNSTASATIATIRTSLGNKLLPSEAYCSRASISCFNYYTCSIKHTD